MLVREKDVKLIFGQYEEPEKLTNEQIKVIDKKRIIEDLPNYLKLILKKMIDRSNYDFWNVLHHMNYRVSPAPIRLLTQILNNDCYNIWSWNRTKIVSELNNKGLGAIAEYYKAYYMTGWDLFNDGFKDTQLFCKIILMGYNLLNSVLNEIEKY